MKEKIKIVANKEATSKEIAGLEDIANSCGLKDFSVENSGGSRELGASMPPELLILIKFSVGALATGFFGAMGVGLWKGIKKLVVKSFKYYENSTEPYLYNPDIYVETKEGDESKIQILFSTRKFKKQELEASLQKLDVFLEKHKLTDFSSIYFSKEQWMVSKKRFQNHEEELNSPLVNEKIIDKGWINDMLGVRFLKFLTEPNRSRGFKISLLLIPVLFILVILLILLFG